jgi:Peptidase family M28
MRIRNVAVALTAAALLAPLGATAPVVAKSKAPHYTDLKKIPKPKITGAEIITGLEELVAQYPMRQSTLPLDNAGTSEFLAKEAKKYGFKTRILELETGDPTVPVVRVIEAVKRGTTKPDEWIAFVAHYDTVEQTLQGAYDDGSGTNIMRFFGKAFSKIKTKHSIALLWFDGEEQGLLASDIYTKQLKEKGQKIKVAMGFDMVGIGYPARYCICIYYGPTPEDAAIAVPVAEHVNFRGLKFPEGDGGPTAAEKWPLGTEPHVCICGPNIRNSDESNFAEQGYFTMRWTGMRTAADYPGYHQPWDTVQFMEAVAGSREILEEGTENTFLSAYYTAMVIDSL